VYGNNTVTISATTTFKARLYRPGYLPSAVQTRLVYVAGTHYYGVVNGWNLLSVPLTVRDQRKASIFPLASGYAYGFDPILGYVRKDTLQNRVGYLLKFNGQQMIAIGGVQRTLDTVALQQGWNLIGTISSPVAIPSVRQIPPGVVQSPYYRYQGGYPISDTLLPSRGYWVKAGAAGKLILSSSSPFDKGVPPVSSAADRAATITIADFSGARQPLYISSDQLGKKELEYFELPPPPPSDIFDARFSTNRILESVGQGKDLPIRISYAQYPLTISWEMKNRRVDASVMIGSTEFRMKGNGSTVVTDPQAAIALRLASQPSPPTKFALAQNYPNPWNPVTTIRYALPRNSFVTLTVFNALGQQVARPVNEHLEAGYHEVEFHGDGLASGVYFYRLDAGGFSSAKKFILLK
jgi:hypothetical protein